MNIFVAILTFPNLIKNTYKYYLMLCLYVYTDKDCGVHSKALLWEQTFLTT